MREARGSRREQANEGEVTLKLARPRLDSQEFGFDRASAQSESDESWTQRAVVQVQAKR